MFVPNLRQSRAELGFDLLADPSYVGEAVNNAQSRWLGGLPENRTNSLIRGVVAFYELLRRARFPEAWTLAHGVAAKSLSEATEFDLAWTEQTMSEVPAAVTSILSSLGAMVEIGNATELAPSHVTAKVLCDAYLDLFEGCLPPLARILLPIKEARSPSRLTPGELTTRSARELFDQLASGRAWKGILVPFDPFYRNGIAHRSTTIGADGSVIVASEDASETRHLSWPHLVHVVLDAVDVIYALLAALELSELNRIGPLSIDSVEAREAVGFFVTLEASQRIDEWDTSVPGMLSLSLRGRRCDERTLLQALINSFAFLADPPISLFFKYRTKNGTDAGWWGLSPDELALAQSSVDGIERVLSEAKSQQLRF